MLAAALNLTCTADATVHNTSTQVTRSPQQGLLPNRQGSKALHSRAHQRHHPSAQNCVPHSPVTLKGSLCGQHTATGQSPNDSCQQVAWRTQRCCARVLTQISSQRAQCTPSPSPTIATSTVQAHSTAYTYIQQQLHIQVLHNVHAMAVPICIEFTICQSRSQPWVGFLNPEPRSLPATPQFVSS